MPPGSGKYEYTLNWIIQTAPESPEYPYAKHPKAIFYVSTRKEVETCNISRFMTNFGPQVSPDRMRELQGKVIFTVDGYDSDRTELCDIIQVRDYYAAIYRSWPAWLFFSDLRTECLKMVARCILPSISVTIPILKETNEHLQAFFLWSLPTAAWCYKHAGIPRADGVSHLQHVARYLGLLD
jgi:hypothetical protein